MCQAGYDVGFESAKRFDANPNKELRRIVLQLAIVSAVGFAVALFVGKNPPAALGVAAVVFFLVGIFQWGVLTGILLAGCARSTHSLYG
jgi:hypothetical protein